MNYDIEEYSQKIWQNLCVHKDTAVLNSYGHVQADDYGEGCCFVINGKFT